MSSASDSVPNNTNTTTLNLKLDIPDPVATPVESNTHLHHNHHASSPKAKDDSPENEVHESLLQDDHSPDFEQNHEIAAAFQQVQTQQSRTDISDDAIGEEPAVSPQISEMGNGRSFDWKLPKKGHVERFKGSLGGVRRSSSKTLSKFNQEFIPEHSYDSSTMGNSYLQHLQELYQGTAMENNVKSSGRSSGRGLEKVTKRHPNRQGSIFKRRIRHSYYDIAKRKLQRRNSKTVEDPEEFEDLVQQIKSSIRVPKDERVRDLQISKKTELEYLKNYNDDYPLLGLRKSLMKVKSVISLACLKTIQHPIFDYFILLVIIANSIILAFNDPTTDESNLPPQVDYVFLAIYTCEMTLKILGMGFISAPNSYLRDYWNIVDFIIVVTAYIPYVVSSNSLDLRAFRSLRVLRPLRTISNIEALRMIIATLFNVLKPLADTLLILFFLFMIFAIGGLQLFQGVLKKRCFSLDTGIPVTDLDEDTDNYQKYCTTDEDCTGSGTEQYICGKMIDNPDYGVTNFDNIFSSLLMVFQTVTLEGWSDIMNILHKTFSPWAALYFIFLIFVGAFFLLNLTLAVIKAEFTLHSHSHSSEKGNLKTRKDIFNIWGNSKIAEKVAEHKLDILSIRKKQAISTIGYNKYQFKRDQLIAVPASKFTKNKQARQLKQKSTLSEKFKNSAGGKLARSFTKLLKDYQASLKKKKISKVHTEKKPQIRAKEISSLDDSPNSTSLIIRKHDSDSPFGNRSDNSKSPAPTTYGDTSFQALYNQDQSRSVLQTIGNDTSLNGGSRSIINLKTVSDIQDRSTPEIPLKKSDSIHRNSRSRLKLDFGKVGELNKIVEVASPHQEEPETRRDRKGKEYLDKNKKAFLMPIMSQAQYKKTEKEELDKSSFISQTPDQTVRTKNPSSSVTRPQMKSADGPEELDSNTNSLRAITPINSKRDRSHIKEIQNKYAGLAKRMSTDRSRSAIIQRLNQVKAFKKVTESKGLNTSLEMSTKIGQGALDRSLAITEDLEAEVRKSTVKMALEEEFKERAKEKTLEEIAKDRRKTRTFKQIALRPRNSQINILDKIKGPEKVQKSAFSNYFQSPGAEGGDNIDIEDDMTVVEHFKKEETENKKEKKLVIDFRRVKAVPIYTREYESNSVDDVLPLAKEQARQRIELYEQKMLREKYLPLEFELTRLDKQRAEHREKLRYQLEEEETELWEDIVKDTANKTVKFAKVPATDKAFKVNSEVDTKIVDQKKLPKKSTNVKVYGKLAIQRSEKARRLARRLKREEMIQEAEQEIKDEFLLCEGTSGKGGGGSRTSGQPSLNKLTFSQKADVPFRINLFDRNININDYKEVRMRINREIYPESTKEESEAKEQENLKALAFENEYKEIRKKDLEAQRITSKNWSGDNVLLLSAIEFPIDRVKTFLSNQDYDIWRTGFMGLIHAMRRKAKFFMNSSTFNAVIIISVLINTIILASNGLIADSDTSSTLNSLNLTFTIIFTIEMGIKIFALGITKYVKDLTNLLDAFIVVLSLVEAVFLSDNGKSAVSAFRTFRLFRTFRVIRMTKLLRSLSYMQIIIGVIVRSLKKFAYIAVLLFLLIFVFSLLGMQIFGGNFSFSDNVGPDRLRESFDTFVGAVMSVIQCMTQENWQDILFLAMRSSVNKIISLAYLISWIFIGNYIFLNLFLAILLDEFMSDEVEEDLKDMPIQSAEENDEDEYRLKNETSAPSVTSRDLPTPKSMKRTRSRNNTARSWAPEDEDEEGERKTYMFEGVRCERAFWLFSKSNIIRRFCWRVVKHRYFESAILTVIILSSVKLALDTYISDDNVELQSVTNTFDDIFNIFFALEALVKVISFGFILDRNSYLRETWNVLDFLIVVASILDMSMDGLNMSFIKILRLLRTFRPLRFISHNVSMRLIVTALLESVSAIFNVLIVVMIVWLMFAILAVNLVGDKLGFCDGLPSTMNYYGIGIEQCASLGGQWTTPNVNFDNVFNAMLSLFIVSTQENWPVIMNTTVDANDASAGPIEGGNAAFGYLFFAVFLFIGSYFLMNLFVGVIFLNFTRAQKSENRLQKFFTLKQQKWIIMQKLILSAKPDLSRVEPHKPWMKKFFRIINHLYFDIFIIAAILLNILTMAMDYDDASDNYENALQYINWFFSFIFVVEMILKHLGLGFRRYWMSPWNQFDAFVVIASLIDILFSIFQQSFLSVLRVGPQLARVLRVLRVSRLLKLVKKFQGLQKIINTLIFSLPSLLNTGALLFLVFFIYSILAVFLFKDITQGDTINDIVNFSNFSNAIITLFRCSTGENWYVIMFDTVYPAQCSDGTDNCGTIAGFAFWLSFIVVCQYIFLNLFILVILQQFEDYHLNPDNPVNQFRTDLDTFKTHWETYALKHGGRKIPAKQLLTFFHTLEAPLGFKNLKIKKTEIAKEITLMNLLADWKGMMFYNDVLFGAMKNAHGSEEALEEIPISIVKEELRTRQKLESLKRKYHFRGSITVGVPRKPRQVQKKAENPIFTMLMIGMTLKAWSNFSHRIVEKRKAAEENEIAYASSENEEEVDDNEDSESSVSSRSSESNSEDRSLDGEIEEQSLIESQRRENIRKPSEKMTSNRSYGTRKRVSVADPEVKEEDHQRDIAPNKSYTIVLTKPDEEDQDERISIQEVNEEQNQVQIVPQMSLEAGKVVENNDNEQNISQMKSSNRTKRSRSMSQGEIDQGKVVINYNINNNYTINNHYYLSQNPLEGEREQLVPFAREVSVEVQRDISPNLSLTASPAKLK